MTYKKLVFQVTKEVVQLVLLAKYDYKYVSAISGPHFNSHTNMIVLILVLMLMLDLLLSPFTCLLRSFSCFFFCSHWFPCSFSCSHCLSYSYSCSFSYPLRFPYSLSCFLISRGLSRSVCRTRSRVFSRARTNSVFFLVFTFISVLILMCSCSREFSEIKYL